jgi:glucokinase
MHTLRYLGIEIGGTKLQLVAGSGTGEILETLRFAAASQGGAAAIRDQISAGIGELLKGGPVAGVGVGFGGPVDWQSGRICKSHQVEGWSGFDMRGWLTGMVNAPVWMDNDANVAK